MKYFCVISHTHWDREWYMSLEQMRLRLVDLMDRCLCILEEYPEYIFHLDAQTIVLEDYLEVRPSKKELLQEHIRSGRLLVGPWYLQNDFYLTSGEATVRNLLEGHRICREFGNVCKVGYVPDQFGIISQLPQILENFDIHSVIHGRGADDFTVDENGKARYMPSPAEYIWEGADGTEVLAVKMPFWYNNAQRFSPDMKKSLKLLQSIEKSFEGVAVTPYLLLMNGVDHLEAQDDLLPVLENINTLMPEDKHIYQCRMDTYTELVKEHVAENNILLERRKGELRQGNDWQLLKGTLSSRSYLKTENVKAQNMLECRLEPFYTMLETFGAKGAYSNDHFRYMYKQLMKNHPHDSICGCSFDTVHKHMEDNFIRLSDTTEDMLKRAFDILIPHTAAVENKDDYAITVANTTQITQSALVRLEVDILSAEQFPGIQITDLQGNTPEFRVLSCKKEKRDIFSPINLPGVLDVDRYELELYAKEVNPFSFKSYIVSKAAAKNVVASSYTPVTGKCVLENEFYIISVSEKGIVNLFDKLTGRTIENAIDIEEMGDKGDSYVFYPADDTVLLGSSFGAAVTKTAENELYSSCELHWSLSAPSSFDRETKTRSGDTVVTDVTLTLTLQKGNKVIEIGYKVENRSKDHRIRVLFHTGVSSKTSIADIPFDIVFHTDKDHYPGTNSKVLPNTSFALLEQNGTGTAVLTEGTQEYEHLGDSMLAFTLVRATGDIWVDSITQVNQSGRQWVCPENQCLRTLTGRLGLTLYSKGYITAEIPLLAQSFLNPATALCLPADSKKFMGGRPAVQDTEISEFFYLKDKYAGMKAEDNSPALRITGEGIKVTAFKMAENNSGKIIRFVNLSDTESTCVVQIQGDIYSSDMAEQKNVYLGKNEIMLSVTAKKIITLLAE